MSRLIRAAKAQLRSARRWVNVRRPGTWSLSTSVVVSVLLVLGAVAGMTVLFTKLMFGLWRPWKAPATDLQVPDLVKLALAIAAGLAGVQALVVAYRRQRDAEADDSRFVSRFESAARQLGDSEPAVRIAGVQAMAGLGDVWDAGSQQCVDVLCAYLRLPLPVDSQLVPAEGQVRQSISRAIAQRLSREGDASWAHLNFDFTGAHLFGLTLDDALVVHPLTFTGATFHGLTRFGPDCVFLRDVVLASCTFEGQFHVGDMNALGRPGGVPVFLGELRLDGSIFNEGLFFAKPEFHGRVSFIDAIVRTMFQITGATFRDKVSFANAFLDTDPVILSICTYESAVIFHDTIVSGSLHLPFSDFMGVVNFGFASVGRMESGVDDVLYDSHIHNPDKVDWGLIPPRVTSPRDRNSGLRTDGSPQDVPTGAIMYFGPGD